MKLNSFQHHMTETLKKLKLKLLVKNWVFLKRQYLTYFCKRAIYVEILFTYGLYLGLEHGEISFLGLNFGDYLSRQ